MDFEFEGIDDLINRLEETGRNVDQTKEEALLEGAKVMQKATQDSARVLTGNLKANVEISDIENGEIEVFVDQQGIAYYGYILEVGSSRMRAKPFMGPAFNASTNKIEQAIADTIRQRLMFQ
ncbi:HK97-gp10 family putative phage morphogenesis protein [Amphibacillus sp. Q70]|uniref:HK97-gp10 family putative phage morphogenesis protein n=1 Tax=Amphibacillus sp. Q70 TaxID=3453416 RepID=UPI003F8653A2